ncbi:hypothetical protein PybrP1_002540 [[Pythium] brassicae (nom. inval.)]|nr:hypothetical protein PybrP1_002540 [[Pythium] brassicae (nom. inval.)]
MVDAAARGRLEVVQWLHEMIRQGDLTPLYRNALSSTPTLGFAIANGDFEMTKYLWLHAQGLTEDTRGWMDAAAAAGRLHIVQWVRETFPEDVCTTETMDKVAGRGDLEMLQWLHAVTSNGGCTSEAMRRAAANGHLEVVQWLHESGVKGTAQAMDAAAGAGHLDVVRWLHEHRSEGCTAVAMTDAAKNGHLDVVRWLHEHRTEGCATWTVDHAAARGHLEVVHEGCTTQAMDETHSLGLLHWLHAHRLEGCPPAAMVHAALTGNFDKLMFLRERQLGIWDTERSARVISRDSRYRNLYSDLSFEIFQWLCAEYPEQIGMEDVQRIPVGDYWSTISQFFSSARHDDQ